MTITRRFPGGVWSATPTPFTPQHTIDVASVKRMVDHQVKQGVAGIMLAGTCGEGPWLRDSDRELLTRSAVEAARTRLHIALQVTDNSTGRILDNIEKAKSWGAEIAVVAQPFFFMNATPARQLELYREVARASSLPLGFYDRGKASPYLLPEPLLAELLTEPNIVVAKDSSGLKERRDVFVAARAQRPELLLLDGDEFTCVTYIQAGYDGLLLGGGIFNASLAAQIIKAVRSGEIAEAERLQARMNDLMFRVYGGTKIECWMTGLKELLVQMRVFSHSTNLLGYPLTDSCREQITAAVNGSDGLGFREDLLGK